MPRGKQLEDLLNACGARIMRFMSHQPLEQYLTVATRAAHQAGRLLASWAGRPKTIRTKRNPIDLVTEIDRASERLLHHAIQRRFPDHGFQGEEHALTNPDAPYRWIVDPLDGTTNFVHGALTFAISIGLVHRGECLVGVVHDPMRRETYTALRGRGSWLNGKRIRVSPTRQLAMSLLSTGFSARFRHHPKPFLQWFTAFQSRCHAVRRIGCTSLSLAYVACGRHDGFYERDLWPWDIAAGILLVQEAGGRVTDFRGHSVRLENGQVVASNGRIHEEMLVLLVPPAQRRRRAADTGLR